MGALVYICALCRLGHPFLTAILAGMSRYVPFTLRFNIALNPLFFVRSGTPNMEQGDGIVYAGDMLVSRGSHATNDTKYAEYLAYYNRQVLTSNGGNRRNPIPLRCLAIE